MLFESSANHLDPQVPLSEKVIFWGMGKLALTHISLNIHMQHIETTPVYMIQMINYIYALNKYQRSTQTQNQSPAWGLRNCWVTSFRVFTKKSMAAASGFMISAAGNRGMPWMAHWRRKPRGYRGGALIFCSRIIVPFFFFLRDKS